MTIELKGGSIATSGGSQRDLGTGPNRIGHILDPRTGSSVVTDVSVTVWHSGGLEADVLSTALYVMGVEDGLAWASANGVAAAFLVPQIEGSVTVLVSPLFRETFLTN